MPLIVPPDGPLDAKIAIIGARPGRTECQTGRGFSGESGDLLWRLLRIPRSSCYVTNVRKDYSPTNSVPTKKEIEEILPELRLELEATQANILIALGGEALFALTGLTGISDWRGSVVPSNLCPGRKVLSTWHPAATLYSDGGQYRNYSWRYVIDFDLRKALREAAYPDIRRPQRTFHINPEFNEAIELLRSLGPTVAVDIETFGDSISCIGFADCPDRAICIPFIGGRYTVSELSTLWREIDCVLRTRGIVGQNIQFDTTRLERLGFQIGRIVHDTMLSHHLLWTELGGAAKRKEKDRGVDSLTGKHSLAFISSIYTDEPFYKFESEAAWSTPGLPLGERFLKYWVYNLKDCCVTYESYEHLDKELVQYKQKEYYEQEVLSLIRPVMNMQDRGLCVDIDALQKSKYRIDLERQYLQLQLNYQVGFECNVKSPIDMQHLLTNVLQMSKSELVKTPTGKAKVDEDTLLRYAYKSSYADIFRLIIAIRERRTMISSFLGLETDGGRYKASYLIHGTDSGRLSSRASGKGPQLQNIPKSARRIFISAPGCIFIQGDLARAEAMYVAYDAQCKPLIDLFHDRHRDLYKEVASRALQIPIDQVQKWHRELFKRVVHGSNYDMGPDKFVIVLRLNGIDIMDLRVPGNSPRAKAQYIQGGYFNAFPEIRQLQVRHKNNIRLSRTLFTAFGRRRIFLGALDANTFRAGYSYPPQGSIVAIANTAIRRLDEAGEAVVLQVHDSVTIERSQETLDEGAAILERAMTRPITLHGRTFTIPVDIKWGRTWADCPIKDCPSCGNEYLHDYRKAS